MQTHCQRLELQHSKLEDFRLAQHFTSSQVSGSSLPWSSDTGTTRQRLSPSCLRLQGSRPLFSSERLIVKWPDKQTLADPDLIELLVRTYLLILHKPRMHRLTDRLSQQGNTFKLQRLHSLCNAAAQASDSQLWQLGQLGESMCSFSSASRESCSRSSAWMHMLASRISFHATH